MLRPRPPLRPRAALLLLPASLALVVGCLPAVEGAPCETDQNCPSSQFCDVTASACREGQRPPRAATLGVTASLGTSATASVGQSLTLTVTVTNTGTVILESIAPTSVSSTGTATGTVLSGPVPTSAARLIPGASASFTYTVQPNATGTLTFSISAQATASDTMETVTGSGPTPAVTVQRPALLEVTSLTGPSTVSRGQVFAVSMVVTNRGEASARMVVPTTPTLIKTGGANAVPGAAPAAITIDGGATGTLQLTFTENGASSGTLQITAAASGTEGNTGAPLLATPVTAATITVQAPAALSITSFTIPATIGRGTGFAASLVVANTGEATASMVLPSPSPPTINRTGGADATTSTMLTAAGIPGGSSRTFTWNYTENGTAPGTLQLAAGAGGTDANTGQPITVAVAQSSVAQVQAGGALTVTSFTIPSPLSRGQSFNAVMVVSNSGGTAVNGVLPSPIPPTANRTGGANATTSTSFVPVTIAAGSSHTFVFNYVENGTAAGTLSFTARASGTDSMSGSPVNSANATTGTATVQEPASLTISSFTLPTNVSRGQTFLASMTVRNNGQAPALNVAPTPNPPLPTTTGGAAATTLDVPAPQTIAGGASFTFTWSYTESGSSTGTFRLSAGASGVDGNSGSALSVGTINSNTAQVETPAALAVTSFTTSPLSAVLRGGTFTANLVVANTGSAAATMVVPSPRPPTVAATGGAAASSATAVTAVTIPGGGNHTFTWTFTENGAGVGTLALSTAVGGQDANSGAPLSVPAVTSNTLAVQTAGGLVISAFSFPLTLSRGQTFTLSMTVQNTGGSAVNNVVPLPNPPMLVAGGQASASTASSPTPVNIGPGGSTTFTWSYTETGSGTGTLAFTGAAQGTDSVGGGTVTAASSTSATAQVQTAPSLSVTSIGGPVNVSRGQTFTVQMVVTNGGQATAADVLPSPIRPTVQPTGMAAASSTTTPTAQSIPGGGSATFSWTFTESGSGIGTLKFTDGAAGTDANTGAAVSAAQAQSAATNVQLPAALSIQSFTIPGVIPRGSAFNAVLSVRNTGGATANLVIPSPNPPTETSTGGASGTTSTNLVPVTITGGANATLTWGFTENGSGPGTLRYTTSVTGTDANSGSSISATALSTGTANVVQPAALSVTSFTVSPATIMRGAGFTVTMVVSNTGGDTANGVLPSPSPPTAIATGGAAATTSSAQAPANIAGGGSATFTWTYTENGTAAGTLKFNAGATGTDADTGAPVSATATDSTTLNVQTPPNLTVTSFTTSRTSVNRGQAFTATMTVANSGGTQANGVLPSPNPPTFNLVSGTPGATTSTTLTPANIAAGASTTFTWSYTENGTATGTFNLSSGATGTNAVTGTTVTAPAVATANVAVQTPAVLVITAFTIPPNTGSSFFGTLSVRNNGGATANGVLPTPQPPIVSGSAVATLSGLPAAQNITGGSTAVFLLTYNVTGVGTVQLRSGASGTDANSGATITAPNFNSNVAIAPIAPPPDVDAAIEVQPRIAAVGSTVTVTLEVTNPGRLPAEVARPAALALEGPAEVELVSAPSLALARVMPERSQRFEWTYRATRQGWVTFSTAGGGSQVPEATSRHLTVPAPWCASSSLLAFAGPAWSGRCNQALTLGGSPSAAGGAGLYRHEWTPGDGLSSPLAANPTATPRLASTRYQITVTDADGCQARDAALAEVTDAPVVALAGEGRAAVGEQVTLSRSLSCPAGGCADSWDLGNGETSALASPAARYLDQGTYAVRYRTTDANGCSAAAEWPVTVGAAATQGGMP